MPVTGHHETPFLELKDWLARPGPPCIPQLFSHFRGRAILVRLEHAQELLKQLLRRCHVPESQEEGFEEINVCSEGLPLYNSDTRNLYI